MSVSELQARYLGGPGSGPHGGGLSSAANAASDLAHETSSHANSESTHKVAAAAHLEAVTAHRLAAAAIPQEKNFFGANKANPVRDAHLAKSH